MKNSKLETRNSKLWAAFILVCGLALPGLAQGLTAPIAAAVPKTAVFLTNSLSTGAAVPATTASTKYTTATFYGYSAVSPVAAPTANAATAYIGFVNSTAAATNITDSIAAGSSVSITAPPGTKFDLSEIRFVGTTGDKILIVYEQ